MALENPQNVELEQARVLLKLIQDSKDEPTELAMKLCLILQHMRTRGRENSIPYQVLSREMKAVIKDNNLDIVSLVSARCSQASGMQLNDSISSDLIGPSLLRAFGKCDSTLFATEMDVCGDLRIHGVLPCAVNSTQLNNRSFNGFGFGAKGCSQSHPLVEHNFVLESASRDTEKSPISQISTTGFPFNEQQLKQLRAQCLVYLSIRSRTSPVPIQLEIALGNQVS